MNEQLFKIGDEIMQKASQMLFDKIISSLQRGKVMLSLSIAYLVFSVFSIFSYDLVSHVTNIILWVNVLPALIMFSFLLKLNNEKSKDNGFVTESVFVEYDEKDEALTFVLLSSFFSLLFEITNQTQYRSMVVLFLFLGISQFFLVLGSIRKVHEVYKSQNFEGIQDNSSFAVSIGEVLFSLVLTAVFGIFLVMNQWTFNLGMVFAYIGFGSFVFVMVFVCVAIHFQYLCIGSGVRKALLYVFGVLMLLMADTASCFNAIGGFTCFQDKFFSFFYLFGQFFIFLSVSIKR